MTFADLGLTKPMCDAAEKTGYTVPTAVQDQAIPSILAGRDVMVGAPTGTGKTAAFALPMIQMLTEEQVATGRVRPRLLILAPTRELAVQVEKAMSGFVSTTHLRSLVVYGGVDMRKQIRALKSGIDILVATPGRLLDLAGHGYADLGGVTKVILDEADRMLDMGFVGDIRHIMSGLPQINQRLLFSATYPAPVKKLADELLAKNYERITVDVANSASALVEQRVYRVKKEEKRDFLVWLVENEPVEQAIVFCRTRHGAERLAKQLKEDGVSSTAIHGERTQNQREAALQEFRDGRVRLLVATDVAARGLDIPNLPYVINFELPPVEEDYVHRIGRTGRAGVSGIAISFVAPLERKLWKGIERVLGMEIHASSTNDFPKRAREQQEEMQPLFDEPIPVDETPAEMMDTPDDDANNPALDHNLGFAHKFGAPIDRDVDASKDGTVRPPRPLRLPTPELDDRGPRRDFGDRPPRQDFGDRPPRPSYGDRPARPSYGNDRGPRRDFGDRPPRPSFGDDRGPRRDFGDRPPRPSFGDDRGPRRDFGDRPPRPSFGGDDRGPRRDFGDRPQRPSFGGDDRGPRRDFGDRPQRPSFGGDDRGPRRDFGERPQRPSFGGDLRGPRPDAGDRPPRPSFGGDDRGPRRDFGDRPQRPSFGGDDRGPRRDFGDRPPRPSFGDDRGPRRDFGDRPPRPSFGDDRGPRRDFGDRPPRPSFGDDRGPRRDAGDRPPRQDFGDRPPRPSFGDRPARPSFGDRPARPSFGDRPRPSFGDRPPRPGGGAGGGGGFRKFGGPGPGGGGSRGPKKFGPKR